MAKKDLARQESVGLHEAARILGTSYEHTRRLVKGGILRAYQIGEHTSPWLVRRSELRRLISEGEDRALAGTEKGGSA